MGKNERKPVVVQTTGLLKFDELRSKIDTRDTTENLIQLQALSLRRRFAMSWPLARLKAEILFGSAA